MEIHGHVDPRFAPLKDAFAENFARRGEVGAAVAVTLGGKPVADLWAGHTDRECSRDWDRDTIVNVFSTTKGLAALCAHRLVDQGRLNLDTPIAHYWPEFAQAGKERIPVRCILTHTAGLPAIKAPVAMDDIYNWETMVRILAAHEPWFEPGTHHAYHAFTMGWLLGEVVRRITGTTIGTYFRDQVAKPLGLDCHIGLDAAQDYRVAQILGADPIPPGQPNPLAKILADPESMSFKAMANPPALMQTRVTNSRPWRGAEIPAANGHTNARALARLYGVLANGGELDGVRILSAHAIAACHTEQINGPDLVLLETIRCSLGYMLPTPGSPWERGPRVFGHQGAGGSVGFADPDAGIGFGYTMNKMRPVIMIDPRAGALIDALYACL